MIPCERFSTALLVAVVLVGSAVAAAPDDQPALSADQRDTSASVEANLARAKVQFREKADTARTPILEKIRSRDDAAREQVDIPLVNKITAERQKFLDEGVIPDKIPPGEYPKVIDAAKEELLKVYDASIKALLKARIDHRVDELNSERKQIRTDQAAVYKLTKKPKEVSEKKPVASPINLNQAGRAQTSREVESIPPVHGIDPDLPLRHDFRVINGTWYLDGMSLVEVERAGENALLVAGNWENYDFQCRLMMMQGDKGVGVFLHYADKENYDRILLGANGGTAIIVEMMKNANRTVLKEVLINPAFQRNQWYDVQVQVRARQIAAFVNGNEVFRQTDNGFASGSVGFSAPWGTVPRYRDIEIFSLNTSANFRGLPALRRW